MSASPQMTDLHGMWEALQPVYLRELPELAYREIPSGEAIQASMRRILVSVESKIEIEE